MNAVLSYLECGPDGQFGSFSAPGLSLSVCTHAYGDIDGKWTPKVPPGVYKCVRGVHQLDHGGPFETFEITGVPGHSGILFHVGNWPQVNSDGCMLLGLRRGVLDDRPAVCASAQAFASFMSFFAHEDEFDLEVRA